MVCRVRSASAARADFWRCLLLRRVFLADSIQLRCRELLGCVGVFTDSLYLLRGRSVLRFSGGSHFYPLGGLLRDYFAGTGLLPRQPGLGFVAMVSAVVLLLGRIGRRAGVCADGGCGAALVHQAPQQGVG